MGQRGTSLGRERSTKRRNLTRSSSDQCLGLDGVPDDTVSGSTIENLAGEVNGMKKDYEAVGAMVKKLDEEIKKEKKEGDKKEDKKEDDKKKDEKEGEKSDKKEEDKKEDEKTDKKDEKETKAKFMAQKHRAKSLRSKKAWSHKQEN